MRTPIRLLPTWLLLGLLAGADAGADATSPDADRRLALGASYTADLLVNASGGLRNGAAWLDYLGVTADLGFDPSSALGRLSLHGEGFRTNAATFSERYVGDAMALSNIDNGDALQVLELWMQWEFGTVRGGSLRVGLYDLNSEFDATEARGLFVSSAHGVGHELAQTGANGPSIFPHTGLAARVAWQPADSIELRVAVLDAVPASTAGLGADRFRLSSDEGALLIAQAGTAIGRFALLSLGHWLYTESVAAVPVSTDPLPARRTRNAGTYVNVETASTGRATRWRAFGRIGYADPDLNEYDWHAAAGLVGDLAWPRGKGSALGIALQGTHPGNRYARSLAAQDLEARTEKTVELTWQVPVGERLTLQPDLQYVDDPAGDPRARDAWVIGLRVELASAW